MMKQTDLGRALCVGASPLVALLGRWAESAVSVQLSDAFSFEWGGLKWVKQINSAMCAHVTSGECDVGGNSPPSALSLVHVPFTIPVHTEASPSHLSNQSSSVIAEDH